MGLFLMPVWHHTTDYVDAADAGIVAEGNWQVKSLCPG
jgi:hypothetical protein